MAYIGDGIPYRPRPDLSTSSTRSHVLSKYLGLKKKKLLIWTINRAPDLNMESLIQDLDTSLSALPENIELILLGDFNVNLIDSNLNNDKAMKCKLIQVHVTNPHKLDQLINKPTWITERSSALIDLLFLNTMHRVTDHKVIHLTISDHSMIFLSSGVTKAPKKTIEYRSFKNYSKEDFVNDLKDVDWESIANKEDVDSAISTWNKLFTTIADRHAPMRKARICGVCCPWMNSSLSQAMSQRNYLQRRAVKSNSPHLWLCYKKLKNYMYVNEEIQKCKVEYYSNLH